ncbi:Homeodomain-like protein [Favolaschia claudopus]|uniref:Homeodomain-like protein n=1 Tax=Favolaschia claudopus TaxID=2862362 RepID=A0AAW0EI28_9AGAR
MTKGKPISEDLRWAIVRMHTLGIHVERIAQYTDISKRQVYRVVNYFVTTGNVLPANQRKKTGRTRHLTTQDIAFLHGSLDQSCDKYLEELQLGLEETCGRSVSLSTIWRALKRSGYTMVKITRVAAERSVVKRAQFKYPRVTAAHRIAASPGLSRDNGQSEKHFSFGENATLYYLPYLSTASSMSASLKDPSQQKHSSTLLMGFSTK